MDNGAPPFTQQRKAALVLDILQGKTTPVAASHQHGVPLVEIDHWLAQARHSVQTAFRDTRTLYIDLDGVMADFDASFPAIFGLDHRTLDDDVLWMHINGHPSFFRDLPPMSGAVEFFRSVEHLQPVILTACPKSSYSVAAQQKRAWVREHLSATCLVLPVLGGVNKPLFMHQAGDVLIDDFEKNCVAWTRAGGLAVRHEGDWSLTTALLAEAGVVIEGADSSEMRVAG